MFYVVVTAVNDAKLIMVWNYLNFLIFLKFLIQSSYPVAQWNFLLGVVPLSLSIGCLAYNINDLFLLVLHAWR